MIILHHITPGLCARPWRAGTHDAHEAGLDIYIYIHMFIDMYTYIYIYIYIHGWAVLFLSSSCFVRSCYGFIPPAFTALLLLLRVLLSSSCCLFARARWAGCSLALHPILVSSSDRFWLCAWLPAGEPPPCKASRDISQSTCKNTHKHIITATQ